MPLFKTQNVCNLHCGWDYKGKLVHRSVPGDWAWVFARAIISRPTAAENIHYWPALYHINQTPAWKPKLKGGENISLLPDAIYDLLENFSCTSHNSSWINIEATFHNYCKNLVGPSQQYFEPWTTFAIAALIKITLTFNLLNIAREQNCPGVTILNTPDKSLVSLGQHGLKVSCAALSSKVRYQG